MVGRIPFPADNHHREVGSHRPKINRGAARGGGGIAVILGRWRRVRPLGTQFTGREAPRTKTLQPIGLSSARSEQADGVLSNGSPHDRREVTNAIE